MSSKRWINRRAVCVGLVVVAALSIWAAVGGTATHAAGSPARDGRRLGAAVDSRQAARRGTPRHGEVRDQSPAGEGGRLRDHHEDDPEHGLPLHEPEREGVQRAEAADPRVRASGLELAARRARVGLSRRSRPRRRFPARNTARSAPAATTRTGRSSPPRPRMQCPTTSPQTGSAFNFWHPLLITMHVWLWYPNPTGLFASTNPLAAPTTRVESAEEGGGAADGGASSLRPLDRLAADVHHGGARAPGHSRSRLEQLG